MNELRKKYTLASELKTKWVNMVREASAKKEKKDETALALVGTPTKAAKDDIVLRSASEPVPEQLRVTSADADDVKLNKLIQTMISENHNKPLEQSEIWKRLEKFQ